MLPASARLRRRDDFTETIRGGSRAARGGLVVHLVVPSAAPSPVVDSIESAPGSSASTGAGTSPVGSPASTGAGTSPVGSSASAGFASPMGAPPRAGFIVSRAVGNAVTRNLVVRRLRHLVRDRLSALPAGSRLVVRALPSAAERSFDVLGRDLDDALRRLSSVRRPSVP